jgi:RNA polymerase sigma factor (sigma-70 family)
MARRTSPLPSEFETRADAPIEAASDRALLDRFATTGAQDAFSALFDRHGGVVLAQCRRLVNDSSLAEDILQATFLVLARRARSILRRESIAGWLYTVARRMARQNRQSEAARTKREKSFVANRETRPARGADWNDLVRTLHEEIGELPDRYAAPLMLCYLDGRTQDETAQFLGLSLSTLCRRLDVGKGKLRERMSRRGATLSAGSFAGFLALSSSRTVVPSVIRQSVIEMAKVGSLSVAPSPAVLLLANRTLRTMMLMNITLWSAITLVAGLLTGIAWQTARTTEKPGLIEKPVHALANEGVPLQPQPQARVRQDPGDGLPAGALARLGDSHLRQGSARFGFLTYSPDGKTLYSGDSKGTAYAWDAASGKKLRQMQTFATAQILQITISKDGKLIAATDREKGIFGIWEFATGKLLRQVQAPEGSRAVLAALSADGTTLATTGGKNGEKLSLWDVRTGQLLRELTLQEKPGFVTRLDFSPDNLSIVTKSPNGDIGMWDLTTGKEIHKFPRSNENNSPSYGFTPDGHTLTAGQLDGIADWDVASGVRRATWKQMHLVNGVVYSPDAKLLAVSTHRSLHLIDAVTKKERWMIDDLPVRSLYILCFSPDSKTLACAGDDTSIRLWDVASSKQLLKQSGHTSPVSRMAFTPDDKWLITWGYRDPIMAWDTAAWSRAHTFKGSASDLGAFVLSPDGQVVHTGDRAGGLYSWNHVNDQEIMRWSLVKEPKVAPHLRKEYDEVIDLALSPDGKVMTAQSSHSKPVQGAPKGNSMLYVRWDVITGKEIFRREESPDNSRGWKLSPDGNHRASYNGKGGQRICEIASGNVVCNLEGKYDYLWPVAWSSDSKLIAGVCRFGIEKPLTIAVWDALTGKELRRFPTQLKGLDATVTFSADARMLAAGAQADADILLWDLATGANLAKFHGMNAPVASLEFAKNGKRLASGLLNGSVLVWDCSAANEKAVQPSPRN